MRHKLLVLTVKIFYNRCTFTEVIAKLKLGYRFFLDHPVGSDWRPETKQGIEGKIDSFRSGRVRDRVRVRYN